MPKISVIVPVYNVEPYLKRCIDSILAQSFTDFELILVDDGSPDNCGAICDEYAKSDNRIIVIHQENGGLSAARNAGLDWMYKNSDSEWVTFIDSDDWVSKYYLCWMYHSITDDVQLVACMMKRVNSCDLFYQDTEYEKKYVSPEEFYLNFSSVATMSCGKLYSRSIFEKIRFPLNKLHEDVFTTHKAIFNAKCISVVNKELYFYYINCNGITESVWNPRKMDQIEGIEEQICFFINFKNEAILRKVLFSYYWVITEQLNKIKKVCPDNRFRKYEKILQKKLRTAIIRYRNKARVSIKQECAILEAAYPFSMKIYWIITAVRKKLEGHNDT